MALTQDQEEILNTGDYSDLDCCGHERKAAF